MHVCTYVCMCVCMYWDDVMFWTSLGCCWVVLLQVCNLYVLITNKLRGNWDAPSLRGSARQHMYSTHSSRVWLQDEIPQLDLSIIKGLIRDKIQFFYLTHTYSTCELHVYVLSLMQTEN